MQSISVLKRAHARSSSSRTFGRRIALVGAATAVIAVPVLFSASAAYAAPAFAVTSPTEGQTDVANGGLAALIGFTGTGLGSDENVQILYPSTVSATDVAVFGGVDVDGSGNWSTTANFGDLAPGQTTITVVVEELAADNTTVVSVLPPLTFTLAAPAVPADPFVVTSPAVASTVTTPTPTFEGTGTPGSTVTVGYTGRSGHADTAGTGRVDGDGNFAIATDFSDLEPGSGTAGTSSAPDDGVRVLVSETDADGDPLPGVDRLAVAFFFDSPPVALIPLSIALDPASSSQTAAASTGVAVSATGFSPDEQLVMTVTDPAGSAVVLSGDQTQLFANETDGSYAGTLVLAANSSIGTYSVTVTGARSARTVSGTFTITADPVVAGGGTSGTGTPGMLASTGLQPEGAASLAALLFAAGAGVILVRRRKRARI